MPDPSFDQDLHDLRHECERLRENTERMVQRLQSLERRYAALIALQEITESHAARPAEPAPQAGPLPASGLPSDKPSAAAAWSPPPFDPASKPMTPPTTPPAGHARPPAPAVIANWFRTTRPQSGSPQPLPRAEGSVELAIGGTWLNRIGAVILFLAVAFFAKYSFDQGWISPTMRVIAAGVTGLALLAAGEWFLHRGLRSFAAGLLGCGVGVLYLAVFAAHDFYSLVSQEMAFALYAAVTLLSIAVAVRASLLAIAVIGFIGGFATPLLVSTGQNKQVELLVYLLALDVAFLVCGAIRRWSVLRLLCWAGTVGLFGGWAARFYDDTVAWRTAGFVLAFYLLFHGEAVAAIRRRATDGLAVLAHLLRADNVAFFASTYFLLRHVVPDWMGLFAVTAAAGQWLTAWRICPRGDAARPARLNLWLDGAAMLALAAPMQFDRYMVSLSWSVQSVVTLYFCRRFATTWLRLKGVGVWFAAAVHLIVYDYHDAVLARPLVDWPLWPVSWMILAFAAVGALAYAGVAVLMARRTPTSDDQSVSGILLVAGTALLLAIFAAEWDRYAASLAWTLLGAAWWGVAVRVRAAQLLSVLILAAAIVKFVSWDTTFAAGGGAWRQLSGAGFNRAGLAGVALAALAWANRATVGRIPAPLVEKLRLNSLAPSLTVAALVLVTWTGTFEVARAFHFEKSVVALFEHADRTRGLFITAFWGINLCVLWPFARANRAALSGYALVLTWLAALRFIFADTLKASMTAEWSVLSGVAANRTFVVGILIILTTLFAFRQIRRISRDQVSLWFGRDSVRAVLLAALVLIAWVPTFEIVRAFRFEPFRHRFVDPSLAMHVALSVFWSLYATTLLVIGFVRRISLTRRVALVFFAITILKVVIVDVGYLERVYRILSFGVLGVLLLFSSWLYQRLSARVTARVDGGL